MILSDTPLRGFELRRGGVSPAASEIEQLRRLIVEYAGWLNEDLGFQGLEQELATLPGKYAEPAGAFLIAYPRHGEPDGEQAAAGCVAMRPLEAGVCEMKRLWVRQSARQNGLGRALSLEIMAIARTAGHRTMRLDTLAHMTPALRLYEGLGFRRIAAYYPNPLRDAVYLECPLDRR
ncbi:MAG: GNAT family N-acetyltransferase [Steroidobacteraceae bacterium]